MIFGTTIADTYKRDSACLYKSGFREYRLYEKHKRRNIQKWEYAGTKSTGRILSDDRKRTAVFQVHIVSYQSVQSVRPYKQYGNGRQNSRPEDILAFTPLKPGKLHAQRQKRYRGVAICKILHVCPESLVCKSDRHFQCIGAGQTVTTSILAIKLLALAFLCLMYAYIPSERGTNADNINGQMYEYIDTAYSLLTSAC